MKDNKERLTEIIVKDKEGIEHKLLLDYDAWVFQSDWYEWREKYLGWNDNELPYEYQFEQWRMRVHGR